MGLLSKATNGSVLPGFGGNSAHRSRARLDDGDQCTESENLNWGFLLIMAILWGNPVGAKKEGPEKHLLHRVHGGLKGIREVSSGPAIQSKLNRVCLSCLCTYTHIHRYPQANPQAALPSVIPHSGSDSLF